MFVYHEIVLRTDWKGRRSMSFDDKEREEDISFQHIINWIFCEIY